MKLSATLSTIVILLLTGLTSFSQEYNYQSTYSQSTKPGRLKLYNDALFVTHPLTHQVLKIALADGSILAEIGQVNTPGNSNTLLNNPSDVDVDTQGNVFIADKGNSRIVQYDASYTYINEINLAPKKPESITIGPDGKFYICYSGDGVGILIYNQLTLERTITSLSSDKFRDPKKVRFAPNGQLHIVDRNTGIIKVSSFSGNQAIVSQLIKKENGTAIIVKNEDCAFSSQGSMLVTSNEDKATANLYQGLYRFNMQGQFVDRIGLTGSNSSNDGFSGPIGLDIDANDDLYIADYNNNRIQVWKATDTQAPSFLSFSIDHNTINEVSISLSLNEQSEVYGLVQENSLPAPAVDDIINPAPDEISFTINYNTPGQLYSHTQNNLLEGKEYLIYYVAKDAADNVSDRLVSEAFSTLAQVNYLVCNSKAENQVQLTLNASLAGSAWYVIEAYTGQAPGYLTTEQIKNTASSERINYPKAINDLLFDVVGLAPATTYRISLFIENNDALSSEVKHYIFSTNDDFELMLQNYRQWCVGDDAIDYDQALLSTRYQAILAMGELAIGNLANYDVNNPGEQYDLVNNREHIDHIRELIRETLFPLTLLYNVPGPVSGANLYFKNTQTEHQIIDLYKYLIARGFVEGCDSEFKGGGVYLGLTGYFYASMLMKYELDKAGLLDNVSKNMQWWTRWDLADIVPQPWTYEQASALKQADLVRTFYNNHLMTILTLPDAQLDKPAQMSLLADIYNESCEISYGWGGFIKPDYTGYHHHGIWGNAYITEALHVMAQMSMIVKDTPYAFNTSAVDNLSQSMLAYRYYCNTYDNPVGISGRFPTNQGDLLLHTPAFAYLLDASNGSYDTELEGAFKRLMDAPQAYLEQTLASDVKSSIQFRGGLGGLQQSLAYIDGTGAELAPQGNRVFPYGNMQIQRRNNWMVSVKGFSKYVWDYENNGEQNWFGRNQSAGALEIFASIDEESESVTAEASGWFENGYDWDHVAGATAFDLPNWTDHDKDYTWAKFSPEYFVGGVSHQQHNGVFAMKYVDVRETGWVQRDYKLSANKSYFFFDDQIICLGSDINSIHPSYETHTTIFQSYLHNVDTPSNINGNVSTGANLSYLHPDNSSVYMTDVTGNSFFMRDGSQLNVTRSLQTSRDNRDKNDTQGNFIKAWLNHGNPTSAGYEYMVWVQAPDGSIEQVATNPDAYYTVEQKDAVAHIVTHHQKKQTGYAIFKADEVINKKHIYSTNNDCIIMIGDEDVKTISFSIAHPDLGWLDKDESLYQVWSVKDNNRWLKPVAQAVEVTLNGQWTLSQSHSSVTFVEYDAVNNRTVLLFDCYNGESIDIELIDDTPTSISNQTEAGVRIYPNPTNGPFQLEVNDPIDALEIINSNGKTVFSFNELSKGHHTINPQLISGTYLIRLLNNNSTSTHKLIVL
ncbi:chondroitinase family polysaccharide lyase [Carboxylicivirga sp. M1479]|uniref:chondroitinase family polysaccharide lyase n=1 Tax=Carboxylicivirga sp. M1479 TaxID=2594476 RepID=UPI00163D41EE|nr:chondroitinase family polysaccharide lyase [Carboxylicivirga sp. M1479]